MEKKEITSNRKIKRFPNVTFIFSEYSYLQFSAFYEFYKFRNMKKIEFKEKKID